MIDDSGVPHLGDRFGEVCGFSKDGPRRLLFWTVATTTGFVMVRKGGGQSVPAWPVIMLSFDGDTAVADAAGVGDPVRVAAYPDRAAAAASAATAAARRLDVTRCRVQGVDADGDVWLMVVDTTTGALEELDAGGEATKRASRGVFGGVGRRLSVIPQRWWLVIGVALVALTAVAVVVIPRTALPVPGMSEPVAEEAPVPPAGQLPVEAPVGWDTYAGWIVDANKPGAAAVLVGKETLVITDGGEVIGLNAETGQEKWRTGVPGDVTQLLVASDQKTIYAARGKTGVTILNAKSGEVVIDADTSAEEIALADVPFARLPGQAGAVLVGEAWERRQVPATAVPVGTIGEGLVSVSVDQQQMWVTRSNNPVLPAPSPLVAPAEGLGLSRVVAFTDARLVTEWADGRGTRMIAIDAVDAEGELERSGTIDAASGGLSSVSVDAVSGLVAVGGLLLDVNSAESVMAPQGTVLARAGYGWSEQTGDQRVRISDDWTVLAMARGAVIPDVILPDGRAVVRAARGADSQAYYVLEVEQPTATPTPEPTSTDGKEQ